jgi:hypothetical protein
VATTLAILVLAIGVNALRAAALAISLTQVRGGARPASAEGIERQRRAHIIYSVDASATGSSGSGVPTTPCYVLASQ